MPKTKEPSEPISNINSDEKIDPKYEEIREAVLTALDEQKNKSDVKKEKVELPVAEEPLVVKEKKNKKKLFVFNKKNKNILANNSMNKIIVTEKKAEKEVSKNEIKKPLAVIADKNFIKKEKTNSHSIWKIFFLSILTTIIILLVALAAGIYIFDWQTAPVKKIAGLLYMPVGFYDKQPIFLADYWNDSETLNYFYTNQVAQGAYKEIPPESEVKNIVWDRLLNMTIVNSLAKKYKLVVSPEEVRTEIDKLVNEAGTREKLADNLYEFYQWDIDTFSNKVIKPYLLEQKVWQQLSSDPTYEQTAQSEAQEVLSRIRQNPDAFADIAKEASDDPGSKDKGGDLGYFNLGVMIPEFEQAALALEPGQISDLVKTQFGYHIIKLEDKKVSEENPDDIQLKASHILIALPTFSEIIEEQKQIHKIVKLLDR
ncbi:MAG: peptidylprolyl isomerase [Candidatus Margulisiibacteriota bacterium]|jgi:hypothetical protein